MKSKPGEEFGSTVQAESRLLLAGQWRKGDGPVLDVLDKFRCAPFAQLNTASPDQVREAVAAADAAFRKGAPKSYQRGEVLDRAAELIQSRADLLVETMQAEAGFTGSDASGEVRRCIQTLKLSAEEARRLKGDIIPLEGAPGQAGRFAFTIRLPLGVVAAITPFNSPLNTVAHKLGPAFAAGNAVVLKPSSSTPFTAALLCQTLMDAGMPEGFLSLVHGGGNVAQSLLAQEAISFFAFTGSTEVGRSIQKIAGLRRSQMELGSIAFTILCGDADLDRALPKVVSAGYRKAGQVCTSIQILLVHESLMDEVERRMTELVAELPYGDPRQDGMVVGPLISEDEAQRVENWVREAVSGGARQLAGGERRGAVLQPVLLTDVTSEMNVGCREVFGPVVCLSSFSGLDDAIERVNATPYGLATGVFTNELDSAFSYARRLRVGGIHINETSSSRVDMMPYGGSKDSGFGREGPHYAIREMSEERIVTITA